MPCIIFNGTKMSPEKKRELISGLTETASQITGIRKESFQVYLYEIDKENIGVGGEVLADRKPS